MGYLIAIEGIDGAGSSTQVELLYNYFYDLGFPVYKTKEPTTSPIGMLIHKSLKKEYVISKHTLALLFAADRYEHVRQLDSFLNDGYIILMDRYILSSLAYQSIDCSPDWIRTINQNIRAADITILIDVPPDVALKRIDTSRKGHELFEEFSTLLKVRENYLKYIKTMNNYFIVDGTLSIDEVFKSIISYILPLIK